VAPITNDGNESGIAPYTIESKRYPAWTFSTYSRSCIVKFRFRASGWQSSVVDIND
jgi:hypothetical protein